MTEVSVIVSTYNRPDYLERVLRGYAVQLDRNFRIVVADDGSGPETAEVIARMRSELGLRIVHVWHADEGFRKSLILNRAIEAAPSDYLLFTDGDCIPRSDLVAVHRQLARRGRYVAGGYLKLSPEVSSAVTTEDIESGRFSDLQWLKSRGWRPGRRALRLIESRRLAYTLDLLTPTAAEFQGNNASVFRESLYEVNGFESAMGYGGLDRALGLRLQNAGIVGTQARFRAIAMHLHHDRPYKDSRVVKSNRAAIARIRKSGQARASNGLSELAPDPSLRIDAG